MGASGCVGWNFDKKGVLEFDVDQKGEEEMMDLAIEAGADDVETLEDSYKVTCAPEVFDSVLTFLDKAGLHPAHSEITYVPRDTIEINDLATAQKALRLTDALDEHEDIQSVSYNFVISDDVLDQLDQE